MSAMGISTIYKIFIVICFLFFFGAISGWCLELVYRRFISKANPDRKWLNPGFLTGPCLPLYGFGVVVLYIFSLAEAFIANLDKGGVQHYAIMFIIMALSMTLIEYIAGIIFINGMHIKLWDYSKEWGNIQGVICPKFTLIWGLLSAAYFFFLFPHIHRLVLWFIENPWFSFTVGTAFGIFVIDFAFSIHLGTVLRKKATNIDRKAALDFQSLQQKLRQRNLSKFFTPHFSSSLTARIESFEEFVKRSPDTLKEEAKN